MPDNQEEVVYRFTGDVSSLKDATQQAISWLDKYDATIKRVASSDTFKASKTSATSFQRVVGGLVKQVNTLTTSLNTTGQSLDSMMPDGTAVIQEATQNFADVLNYLDSSTSVTSKDLQFLTEILKQTRSSLDSVTARASVLTSSLKPLEQLQVAKAMEQTSTAATKVQEHYDTAAAAGFRIQEAYKASGKSAADTAIAFLKAERAATRMTGVQSVLKRVQTEMNLLGAYATKFWQSFMKPLDPVVSKLQSFKSKMEKSLGRVRSEFDQVRSALRRFSKDSDAEGDSLDKLSTRSTKLSDRLRGLQSSARKSASSFNVLNKATSTLKAALHGLIGLRLGTWLADAANQSIRYTEHLNLFTVATGDAVDQGTDFVNRMSEIYGMDPSNLMRYAGNFYQLADAISMPDEAAANLSLGLTKATNDIASLFNADVETVFNDLSSGMQGMSRVVRKYGMDIRTTTLQQTALTLGIKQQVETMSEANRQGLRFITMMRQASNASGDFAKTIESPANQLRIFQEQMAQLGRAIGDLFIGPLSRAIAYINGFVMALRMMISFVASLFGVVTGSASGATDAADSVASSIGGIGDAAGSAAKKLKGMLAPFDELNVLQQADSGGGGGGGGGALSDIGALDPAIEQAIADMQWQLENVRMKALDVRDAILEFFGFKVEDGQILDWDAALFEQNLINKFPQWTKTIQAVFDNWSSIIEGFKRVFNGLGDVAQAVWDKVVGFFSKFINDDTVSSFIAGLSDQLNTFADFLSNNADDIADFAISVALLRAAFKGFGALTPVLTIVGQFMTTCTAALGSFSTLVTWVGAVVAGIALLYASSQLFANSFNNLLLSVGEGLGVLLSTLVTALQTIGASVVTLWTDNIQPMLAAIGDAVAPVVESLIDLWEDLVAIVSDIFTSIADLWESAAHPALAAFFDALTVLANLFGTLWSGWVAPVLSHIGDGLTDLWINVLSPIIENVIALILGVIEIVLQLWNKVLGPLVDWLAAAFGPTVANVFNFVWDVIQVVVGAIGTSINGLLGILKGVITFINGVFAGDWSRAWQGVVEIFSGIWDTIAGIVKGVFNLVISAINGVLGGISGAINGIIRAINKISVKVPDWVPGIGGSKIGFNIKEVGTWSVPYLANGGVVTSPTMAMVGEGKYDEAVIPLGNSPQMKDLVNQIAEATRGRGDDEPIQVNVFIGNEQVAEYMHKAEKRHQLQTNGGI